MPDPLTHLCTALLPKAIVGGRHTGVFAVGVSLPDMSSRLPGLLFERIQEMGIKLPDAMVFMWSMGHTPLGSSMIAMLLTFLFPEDKRRTVCGWLLGGIVLHFAADILQFHNGQGYSLLFPLSSFTFELGWIDSEATVPWAPWLALVTGLAWGIRFAIRGRGVKVTTVTDNCHLDTPSRTNERR